MVLNNEQINYYLAAMNTRLTDLEKSLIKHEGFCLRFYYVDDILHTGVGHNCETEPKGLNLYLTMCEGNDYMKFKTLLTLLREDIEEAQTMLTKHCFKAYNGLNTRKKNVLIEMCFQMGIGSFLEFKKTIKHLENKHFELAYQEAKDSKWYRNHKKRAEKVLEGLREPIK